jgi:hypothetical protein
LQLGPDHTAIEAQQEWPRRSSALEKYRALDTEGMVWIVDQPSAEAVAYDR